MDEEEKEKKFEIEENGEEEGKKKTLDKEALCERLTFKMKNGTVFKQNYLILSNTKLKIFFQH